jgi:hypothetical protein
MKKEALVLGAAGVLLYAVVRAFAGVGDVVSSFAWPGALNAYRDASYVYCVAGVNTLRTYTVSGSLTGTVPLAGLTSAGDADHSPSGPGYFAVIERSSVIYEYLVSSGSFVRSITGGPNTVGGGYFPGSSYVYIHVRPYVYRFTTAGSLVGSFLVSYSAGPIAATDRFNARAGDYVIVGAQTAGNTMVYTGAGSVVTTFTVPGGTYGCVCGPGYPPSYGTTYWCNLAVGSSRYAYQIELGNGTAVAPASVGKIKALYR